MKINTFVTSNTYNKINNDIEKLANPSKTDDIVNKFIQDVYESDINTATQQIADFHSAIGFTQIADGALQSVSDNVSQIKSLQVRANNATLNSDNLAAINDEIDKLSQNINDTLTNTTFNGKSVFGEFDFNSTRVNTTMPSFSPDNIDDFEKSLNNALNSIGAFGNFANSQIDSLSNYVVATSNAKSQNETDIANTVTDMKNNQITLNAALLAQAHSINVSQESLMNLLT